MTLTRQYPASLLSGARGNRPVPDAAGFRLPSLRYLAHLHGAVPWEQLIGVSNGMLGDALEGVAEVGFGFEAAELGGRDQGGDRGCSDPPSGQLVLAFSRRQVFAAMTSLPPPAGRYPATARPWSAPWHSGTDEPASKLLTYQKDSPIVMK